MSNPSDPKPTPNHLDPKKPGEAGRGQPGVTRPTPGSAFEFKLPREGRTATATGPATDLQDGPIHQTARFHRGPARPASSVCSTSSTGAIDCHAAPPGSQF